jgi:small subunit ribosomal protein S13
MLFVKILDTSKDKDKIMARISGVDIQDNKKIFIGLTAIFGVGRSNVSSILEKAKIDKDKRAKDLTNDEILSLQKAIEEIPTGGALRKIINENIKRLQISGSYRGLRHSMGLPGRGQRTRSNARTKKGKKKTVGSISKSEKSE